MLAMDASAHRFLWNCALRSRAGGSMSNTWRTAWQGQEIVVFRDEAEVDRVNASQIQRVVFVYESSGESPGDLLYAIVETADDGLIFPAETGFAGRVNFERVDYWA